jgi:tripartite-type tricarboxylate transporter receptor subunit TctC
VVRPILVAQKLTEQTGKNFFVENISGAGGNVGAIRAAKSSPDGSICSRSLATIR